MQEIAVQIALHWTDPESARCCLSNAVRFVGGAENQQIGQREVDGRPTGNCPAKVLMRNGRLRQVTSRPA